MPPRLGIHIVTRIVVQIVNPIFVIEIVKFDSRGIVFGQDVDDALFSEDWIAVHRSRVRPKCKIVSGCVEMDAGRDVHLDHGSSFTRVGTLDVGGFQADFFRCTHEILIVSVRSINLVHTRSHNGRIDDDDRLVQ